MYLGSVSIDSEEEGDWQGGWRRVSVLPRGIGVLGEPQPLGGLGLYSGVKGRNESNLRLIRDQEPVGGGGFQEKQGSEYDWRQGPGL